jgi:hypothetical protein
MPGLVTYPAAKVGRALTIRLSLVALIVVRKALGSIALITISLVEALALIALVLVAVTLTYSVSVVVVSLRALVLSLVSLLLIGIQC